MLMAPVNKRPSQDSWGSSLNQTVFRVTLQNVFTAPQRDHRRRHGRTFDGWQLRRHRLRVALGRIAAYDVERVDGNPCDIQVREPLSVHGKRAAHDHAQPGHRDRLPYAARANRL
jgi:hypothetical protein